MSNRFQLINGGKTFRIHDEPQRKNCIGWSHFAGSNGGRPMPTPAAAPARVVKPATKGHGGIVRKTWHSIKRAFTRRRGDA